MLNNKGNPVKQYEPFFYDTHEFVFDHKVGVSSILIYDPLDRVVAKIQPNHAWTKAVFNNWETKKYDTNDTTPMDPKSDADIGHFVRLLPDEDYLPTWFDGRISGQMGQADRMAAAKAALHSNTPAVQYFDPLGRAFATIIDNGELGKYETRVDVDIQGHLRHMFDPKGRRIMDSDYDMMGRVIHTASLEAGERWLLSDVSGGEVYSWDIQMNQIRTEYDALGRPSASFLKQGSDAEVMVERITYGESETSPERRNSRGRVVKIFDQAGIVNRGRYDFKGNQLLEERQLAENYTSVLDWKNPVALEDATYTTSTTYDALNRPVQTAMPDHSVLLSYYNKSSQLKSVTANIRGADAMTWFIKNVVYNAKGQRTYIDYSNRVVTSYNYDLLISLLTYLTTRCDPYSFPDDSKTHTTVL